MTNKKLIETTIPLEAINVACEKEKNPFLKGHPRALHIYFARRPLAVCRALLFAQLIDDPASRPDLFGSTESQLKERDDLFSLIREMITWNGFEKQAVKAKVINKTYCGDKLPPIMDPFAGGFSIPLEAQRLGLHCLSSDLNPVSVLIGKASVDIPCLFSGKPPINPQYATRQIRGVWNSKNAEGLAEDVRYYGNKLHVAALDSLGKLFPSVKVGKEDVRPLAWIWCRTVESPNPALNGVHVPLVKNFLLSSKSGRKAWAEPCLSVAKTSYEFMVRSGEGDVPKPTVGRTSATCLLSGQPIPLSYIQDQARQGRLSEKLMAIVVENKSGRLFLNPDPESERAALTARPAWIPDLEILHWQSCTNVVVYGLTKFSDLFSPRQRLIPLVPVHLGMVRSGNGIA